MAYMKLTHVEKPAREFLINLDQVCWIVDAEDGENIYSSVMFANGETRSFRELTDDIASMMDEHAIRQP